MKPLLVYHTTPPPPPPPQIVFAELHKAAREDATEKEILVTDTQERVEEHTTYLNFANELYDPEEVRWGFCFIFLY